MKIYLAGPDVFRANAKQHGETLKRLCKEAGHEGMFPFDNEFEVFEPKLIFEGNFDMLKSCDIVLANMEPFRGPSIDVGTAWEIGAAKALGKKVILYNSTGTLYEKKVTGSTKFPFIEEFGLEDNLMIICGADAIFSTIEEALESI